MAGHQESEISQTPMSKAAEFLGRLHMAIKGPLPVIFLGFQYFLLMKDDAWGMFFCAANEDQRGDLQKIGGLPNLD